MVENFKEVEEQNQDLLDINLQLEDQDVALVKQMVLKITVIVVLGHLEMIHSGNLIMFLADLLLVTGLMNQSVVGVHLNRVVLKG